MISELPRSQAGAFDGVPEGQRNEFGVTHREILWRIASLRPAVRRLKMPDWLDPVVLLLIIGYLLGGIAAAPFSLEEAVQTSLTQDAAAAVRQPGSLVPGGAVSPSQESVRLGYGSITRYTAALGWYVSGGRGAQSPIDLTAPNLTAAGQTAAGQARSATVRVPSPGLLIGARTGPALLAVLAVLVVFWLGRRLYGRPGALIAALVFGLHPSIALVSRQAVDAGLTLTFGLASILVAMGISATVARDETPGLGSWTALAGLTGLTLASGPTAPPYVAGAAAFCCTGLIGRVRRRHRRRLTGRPVTAPESGGPAGWLAVTALGAVLIWVLVSPALWGWLPQRLETRHQERATLVAERLLPEPGPSTGSARLRAGVGVLTDPFLTPARLDTPARPDDGARLARYRRSWWSGLPLGTDLGPLPAGLTEVLASVLGAVLTVLAAIGVLALGRKSPRQAVALGGWALATAAWLVLWPSRQVDQGTPLIAIAALLAGAAVPVLLSWLCRADLRASNLRSAEVRPADLGWPDQPGDDRGGHPDQR